MKKRFYNLKPILSKKAQYNIIFGGRSIGKTYAVFEYCINEYVKTGKQMALIRRYDEDFRGKRGAVMFDSLIINNVISKITNGKWNNVYYYASKWYLCKYEENGKRISDETPFCYGFSLTAMEHDKSTSYPNIQTIVFDEFISRGSYLTDEFVLFMNVISTIVRHRTDVIIFMLGNTVNQYCPYFNEMGLTHIKNMKSGDIDIYRYGNSDLRVAVEYAETVKSSQENEFYFAFDNPKLNMITGGTWEIDVYPHCPIKYRPMDVVFTYFIDFNGELLQCEIIEKDEQSFTFVHKKTTPIKNPDTDLIYSTEYSSKPNRSRKITKPHSEIERKIAEFYAKDKVFFADNETGEIMRNYLLWCKG